MPRVCHITSAHKRHDTRIFRKECVSLANAGYDVILLVNDDQPDEALEGVQIRSTGSADNSIKGRVKILKTLLKLALRTEAEVYHLHDPELIYLATKLKRKNKKVIFDFHENMTKQILTKEWIPGAVRGLISGTYRTIEKWITKRIDAAVVVTPDMISMFKPYNQRAYLITNYPHLFDSERKAHEGFVLCFAGGADPQWKHDVIIKAIAGMEGVKYRFATPVISPYLEGLKDLPAWDNQVEYLGRLKSYEVIQLYETSDVGMTLLANNTQVGRRGTLGNTKIFEFMAARLPIICSNHEVWQDIIDRYHCGIAVDSDSQEQIEEAIRYLRDHPQEAIQMGLRGRQATEEQFNWQTQEKVLLAMYQDVLS